VSSSAKDWNGSSTRAKSRSGNANWQTFISTVTALRPFAASFARSRASMGADRSTHVSCAPASASGREMRPVPAISSNTGPEASRASATKKGMSAVVVT
jgi:hypothetical protein